MKKLLIYILYFSLSLSYLEAQELQESALDSKKMENDSVTTKFLFAYNLRVGVDLSRPLLGLNNQDYTGFELVGDLRISDKLYIATEIGNENKTIQSEQINFTTSGSYLKFGIDYNMYSNPTGVNNQIYCGFRIGNSAHSQTVNNYVVWNLNRFWPEENSTNTNATVKHESLSASWLEIIAGIKTQILKNVYMGFSLRLTILLADQTPQNFDNLFIPGYNRKTDDNNYGTAYNYTMSYSLPLFKKKERR